MTMGVYCIQVEKENHWQSYVGISNNIQKRWNQHKSYLRGEYHNNQFLQGSWNKYGEKMFEFHILEEVDCYDKLPKLEKEYAYAFGYGDYDLCFNVGAPGETNSMVGKKHTEKTKQKISEALKGEKSYWFGKKHTEETKQKMKEAMSEEVKQKIRERYQGEKGYSVKLTELQARFILTIKTTRKNKYAGDFKQQKLADYFGVSLSCIQDIMQRRSWKHIEPLSIEEYEKFKQEIQNST